MSGGLKDWEKLDVTRDEINQIGEALKKEEFRKMLVEYCEEISDPENRKIYESEITQLENERGIDIQFIHPTPGYVIKTSSDGQMKTFINVCTNEKVVKPSNESLTDDNGQRGLKWSIPYSLAPPRRDTDRKGAPCHVYDVVFHPDTLHLASKHQAFRKLVNDTACDAVQDAFKCQLDRANLKFPKLSFKGIVKPAVTRKRNENTPNQEPSPLDSIYPPIRDQTTLAPKSIVVEKYTTPKYKLVQRRDVQFHEMTNELDSKINVALPKELVLTIDLPLLNSTQDCQLDVTQKMVRLISEKPAKYKLDVALPYKVNETDGSAKFDKIKRQLLITLPVVKERPVRIADLQREDSGIESDHHFSTSVEHDFEQQISVEAPRNDSQSFLEKSIEYVLPTFTFNQIDEIMAFTLHVKNVDPSSIEIQRNDLRNLAHVKFSSLGSGYFPIYYSFCVKFECNRAGLVREVTAEAWDNNVIFQFELNSYGAFENYLAGLTEENLISYDIMESLSKKKSSVGTEIEDDSLSIEVKAEQDSEEVTIEIKANEIDVVPKKKSHDPTTSNDEVSEDVFGESKEKMDVTKKTKRSVRKRNKKTRSLSESCCDELKVISEIECLKLEEEMPRKKTRSLSESSSDEHIDEMTEESQIAKCKGILKRRNWSECSLEQSSIDDNGGRKCFSYSVSADFGMGESHDSLSESCKKTVRFDDNIKKQLFRSNTSILAQKKKNQKKKASRMRAIVRRHSEGSESEKIDEDFDEKNDGSSSENVDLELSMQPKDSGVDLLEMKKTDIKVKNKKSNAPQAMTAVKGGNGSDILFKSGMIFDLEM